MNLKERSILLRKTRVTLPIWSSRNDIRRSLSATDVLLLVGETGSGKSTQIPHFLITEVWCQPREVHVPNEFRKKLSIGPGSSKTKIKVGGCIAITQPRRVAAISLARRVADEMGTTLGSASPASKVGYSVRFDHSTSPAMRVKFLTEGMLLQEMIRDPWLLQYSAVVVDEVHERGVNVDLVLGFLHQIVNSTQEGRGGVGLKVVVMSATAEMETLIDFFGHGPKPSDADKEANEPGEDGDDDEWEGFADSDNEADLCGYGHIPSDVGKEAKKPGDDNYGDEWAGFSDSKNDLQHSTTSQNQDDPDGVSEKMKTSTNNIVSTCHIHGRQHPVGMIYEPSPVKNIVDASLRLILKINHSEPLPGDILVFLTGQSVIESLHSSITECSQSLDTNVPKILSLPLFAALPQTEQQRVFSQAPRRTRKVIISTNVAETSVTVPGVRFVIDCGKSKMKRFSSLRGLNALLVRPISKSAAIQRAGRAGREAPGKCYRLYTKSDFEALTQSQQPEILRCDLTHAILTMKARGVNDIAKFPFLSPPPRQSLAHALLQLFVLGALHEDGSISTTGKAMARLPLSAPLGRALLAAAEPEAGCIDEMIDIIAALSVEDVFLQPPEDEEAREKAEKARSGLLRRESDHLTLLATVRGYLEEKSDRKRWAAQHWVNHRAMKSVVDVRKQLLGLKGEIERASGGASQRNEERCGTGTPSDTTALLKALLKGFPYSTALLCRDKSYKEVVGKRPVTIHPSSVMFGKQVEAIVYSEHVFTTKSYVKAVSAVQAAWITEAVGASAPS